MNDLQMLVEIFADALNRCEHCGNEGEVFDCDDCQDNKVRFMEHMVNILPPVEADDGEWLINTLTIFEAIL